MRYVTLIPIHHMNKRNIYFLPNSLNNDDFKSLTRYHGILRANNLILIQVLKYTSAVIAEANYFDCSTLCIGYIIDV